MSVVNNTLVNEDGSVKEHTVNKFPRSKAEILSQYQYPGQCAECSGSNNPYMLIDELWAQVTKPGEEYLCLLCVEKRLKRDLHLSDFKDEAINEGCFGFDARAWTGEPRKGSIIINGVEFWPHGTSADGPIWACSPMPGCISAAEIDRNPAEILDGENGYEKP